MAEFKEAIEPFGLNSQERAKTTFSRIGVVGCGREGQNVVRQAASAGLEVIFLELSQDKIEVALNNISRSLDTKVENWGLTTGEKKTILSRIVGTMNYEDLHDCDFVIECTRHESETGERNNGLRKEVFHKLEEVLAKDAIIATNASTVIISELAADLHYKERCISLHFLVSQPDAKILEIVKGIYTSEDTYKRVMTLAKMIKHDVINVQESAGLVSVRMFAVMLNEACQMLMENVTTKEEIDRLICTGWGHRLGVFRTADVIGIGKMVALMNNMYNEYGDKKYVPSPILKRLFRAKQLGVSTGSGFYQYDADGKIIR
ncbi:MAG: 3-hydroxyacyl-CoA dehydrogenase family protein [Bacteroidales bacterium]